MTKQELTKIAEVLDLDSHYMEVVSGSGEVQTGRDWIEEQEGEGYPVEELETLIEVEKDENGDWIEVE